MNYIKYIIKYTLYISNIIFAVCGILLIILGSIMLSSIKEVSSLNQTANTQGLLIIIIVLGCLVSLVSFFGCCGAIRENIGFMTTYVGITFLLLFIQIVLVIWIFNNGQKFLHNMGNIADNAWEENDSANGYPMDALQISFKCCGLYNFTDYNEKNQTVPFSCCGGVSSAGMCPEEVYYLKPGCRSIFVEFWATNINFIRFTGIGVAFVELIELIFACYLISNLRKQLYWYYGHIPAAIWEVCWRKIHSTVSPFLAQFYDGVCSYF